MTKGGGDISISPAPWCFFWVLCVVASMAQADQISVVVGQLRKLVRMLDVVYLGSLSGPAIPLADLAAITIPP